MVPVILTHGEAESCVCDDIPIDTKIKEKQLSPQMDYFPPRLSLRNLLKAYHCSFERFASSSGVADSVMMQCLLIGGGKGGKGRKWRKG